jgi:hypothetical protein
MAFIPISIDKYVKLHLKSNPSENEKILIVRLEAALDAYKKGIKCHCGNDIWVIGSSQAGNSCFTCITGESHPKGDYEIDSALDKVDYKGRRHIDEMDPTKIAGFFSDDGYEINPDLIKMPSLCLTCLNDYDPGQEDDILCSLNRYDQSDSDNFKCHAYEKM